MVYLLTTLLIILYALGALNMAIIGNLMIGQENATSRYVIAIIFWPIITLISFAEAFPEPNPLDNLQSRK